MSDIECIAISSDEEDNVVHKTDQKKNVGFEEPKEIETQKNGSPSKLIGVKTHCPVSSMNGGSMAKRITPIRVSASTSFATEVLVASTSAVDSSSGVPNNYGLFGKFMSMCSKKDNCPEMHKITAKLYKAYDSASPGFRTSDAFLQLLNDQLEAGCQQNFKVYVSMKNVWDELKYHKKNSINVPQPENSESIPSSVASNERVNKERVKEKKYEDENPQPAEERTSPRPGPSNEQAEDSEADSLYGVDKGTKKNIRRLEKSLRALHRGIKKLEEKEVKWEREEESSYILLDRCKARFAKVYAKVCQLRKKAADADRPIKRRVNFQGSTNYPDVDRYVEKIYNHTRKFPDFHDILDIVKEVKKNDHLAPDKIHKIAEDVFKKFVKLLKIIRQEDEYDIMCSYLPNATEPAVTDQELSRRLNENYEYFKKKEEEVIDSFAQKEVMNGLEPEEVVGSGDDDDDNNDEEEHEEDKAEEESEDEDLTGDDVEEEDSDSDSEDDNENEARCSSPEDNDEQNAVQSDDSDNNDRDDVDSDGCNSPKGSHCSSDSSSRKRKIDDSTRKPNKIRKVGCLEDENDFKDNRLCETKDIDTENGIANPNELFSELLDKTHVKDSFSDKKILSKCSDEKNIVQMSVDENKTRVDDNCDVENFIISDVRGNYIEETEIIKKINESADEAFNGLRNRLSSMESKKAQRDLSDDDDCVIEHEKVSPVKTSKDIPGNSNIDVDVVFHGKSDGDEVQMITAQKKLKRTNSKVDVDTNNSDCLVEIENKITLSYRQPKINDIVKPLATSTPEKKKPHTKTGFCNPEFKTGKLVQSKLSRGTVEPSTSGNSGCGQKARVIYDGKRAEYISNNNAKKVLSMANTKVFTKGIKNGKSVSSDEVIIVD